MNKKGFTVVELLASFTLSMIIIVFLFQIIIELKDIFTTSAVKTDTLSKIDIVTDKIYDLIDQNNVTVVTCTEGTFCLTISGSDSTNNVVFDNSSHTVKVGATKTVFSSDITFKNLSFSTIDSGAVTVYSKKYISNITGQACSPSLNDPININMVLHY